MKILLTGFDKFGKDSVNPSIEAVKRLPDKIDNAIIIKKEIPTVYKKSVDILLRTIEKEKVDVVLNVGQAGGREGISIEKVGININDFRIPDNEGNVIIDEKIIQTGDDAYFVNIPVKAIVKNLNNNGIQSYISYSAGTFICNYVCYYMAYLTRMRYKNMRSGFIHVPYMDGQLKDKNIYSMPLDNIVEGLEIAIKTIITTKKDIKYSYGTLK